MLKLRLLSRHEQCSEPPADSNNSTVSSKFSLYENSHTDIALVIDDARGQNIFFPSEFSSTENSVSVEYTGKPVGILTCLGSVFRKQFSSTK
jgi:hypothetical protein